MNLIQTHTKVSEWLSINGSKVVKVKPFSLSLSVLLYNVDYFNKWLSIDLAHGL